MDTLADRSGATPRRRRTRWAAVMAVLAALVLSIALNPSAAMAAAGQASGLTIKVTADGSAPWDSDDQPGYDSSPTNGRVRTHDYVTYQWGYSVATAGDVTLVQTLPENMSWVIAESAAACAEGVNAVSEDGRTITCTRQDQTTGAATYQVKAMVDYGTNGQLLSTVLSSAGTADSAPAEVTVSAAPTFNLLLTAGASSYVEGGASGTEPGYRLVYRMHIYQPVDPVRGIRGSEPLADTFSFTVDPSAVSSQAQMYMRTWQNDDSTTVGSWNVRPVISGGASTAANSVPGRGTWGSTQSALGEPITVTVTNAITDLRSYPTHDLSGTALDPNVALVSGNELQIWVPSEDAADKTISIPTIDFDPVSASGQSNYGAGYAPGQEPGAVGQDSVNQLTFRISTANSVGIGLSRTFAETGELSWTSVPPEGATSTTSGDAPMRRGQTLCFGGLVQNSSGSGTAYTNMSLCAVWDEALMSVGDLSTTLDVRGIEYAHLDVNSDAERRDVTCGSYGSGGDAWSDSIEGAGGAGQVNAVRFAYDSIPAPSSFFLAVALTRTDQPLATGTALPVFWQIESDQTSLTKSGFVPETMANSSLGSKARALDTEVSVDLAWPSVFGLPGERYTMTAQPVLSDETTLASDATLAITLPASVTMVEGSWPSAITATSTTGDDGTTTHTFALGDLTPGNVPAVTFDVNVSSMVQMPTSLVATAVISSPDDFRTEAYRTATASMAVNAPSSFSISKSVTATQAIPGVPLRYTIGWVNGLDVSVGTGKIVDVLPFNGDGRGTEGLNGLSMSAVSVEADMTVDIEYTTDDSAAVMAAITADRSGDSGVTWLSLPSDDTVPPGVTAVRFVTAEILGGMAAEATMELTPGVLSLNGAVVNDVSGLVTGLDTPVSGAAGVKLVSGAAQISGTVYEDQDYSWALTDGDTGLSGVTLRATGYTFGANQRDDGGTGDDVVVTDVDDLSVITDSDGGYVLDGLAPGRWTLTIDPTSAAIVGLDPAATPELPITLMQADSVTDIDFGFMESLDAPELGDDAARVSAGDTITLDVLDNDTFDASAVITEVTAPAAGSITWAEGDTTVDYTAPADGAGEVTFTYTVQDKARQSATATVTVTVVPLPTASNSTVVIGQRPTVIDLAGLFTGDAATVTVSAGSLNGTEVAYTPTDTGEQSFSYTVTDAMGKTATGTVTVIVLQAPDLTDDEATTVNGTAVAIPVTDNDVFVGTGTLTVASDPANGTATVDGTVIIYTPTAGFLGTDSLTYTVTDEVGQSASATVSVIVVDAMALTDDVVFTGVGVPVTIDVLANDVATGGVITEVGDGALGTTDLVNGEVLYTPSGVGTDSFTYTVRDNAGTTASAAVTVTVLARPTAEDSEVRTGLDTPVSVDLVAIGDGLTLATNSDRVVIDGTTVTYTPVTGFVGEDVVALTWTDSVGQTVTATLKVEVVDAPVANDDTADTVESTAITVDVLANDQGEALTVTAVSLPMFGTAEVTTDGHVRYTPQPGYSGPDAVVYTATDAVGQNVTAELVVLVYAAPRPPHLSAVTGERMAVIVDPMGARTTSDALLAPWAITTVGGTDAGEVVLNEDSTITFTPAVGFTGETSFTYAVMDTLGQSGTGTVAVDVRALTLADMTVSTGHNSAVTVDVAAAAEGVGVAVTGVSDPAHGTAVTHENGTVTYSPPAGFSGTDTFTVTVTDELGQSATAVVTVTVAGPVGPPDGGGGDGHDTADPEAERSHGVLATTGTQDWWSLVLLAFALMAAGARVRALVRHGRAGSAMR